MITASDHVITASDHMTKKKKKDGGKTSKLKAGKKKLGKTLGKTLSEARLKSYGL